MYNVMVILWGGPDLQWANTHAEWTIPSSHFPSCLFVVFIYDLSWSYACSFPSFYCHPGEIDGFFLMYTYNLYACGWTCLWPSSAHVRWASVSRSALYCFKIFNTPNISCSSRRCRLQWRSHFFLINSQAYMVCDYTKAAVRLGY